MTSRQDITQRRTGPDFVFNQPRSLLDPSMIAGGEGERVFKLHFIYPEQNPDEKAGEIKNFKGKNYAFTGDWELSTEEMKLLEERIRRALGESGVETESGMEVYNTKASLDAVRENWDAATTDLGISSLEYEDKIVPVYIVRGLGAYAGANPRGSGDPSKGVFSGSWFTIGDGVIESLAGRKGKTAYEVIQNFEHPDEDPEVQKFNSTYQAQMGTVLHESLHAVAALPHQDAVGDYVDNFHGAHGDEFAKVIDDSMREKAGTDRFAALNLIMNDPGAYGWGEQRVGGWGTPPDEPQQMATQKPGVLPSAPRQQYMPEEAEWDPRKEAQIARTHEQRQVGGGGSMVLPGMRTDPRTPGGMADSGRVNPGGPTPSVPQGTRQPNMGAGIGEPDSAKMEELFNQYTSGQISLQDLEQSLHDASEGQGGILGLLKQGGGAEQSNVPMTPGQPTGDPTNPLISQSLNRVNTAATTPSLTKPLDARHHEISLELQNRGIDRNTADQMSLRLNPHAEWHRREYSTDEDLWMDVYDKESQSYKDWAASPESGLTPATHVQGSMAYDPQALEIEDIQSRKKAAGTLPTSLDHKVDQGSAAQAIRATAGLGMTAGSRGAGIVDGQRVGDLDLQRHLSENRIDPLTMETIPGVQYAETPWSAESVAQSMADMDTKTSTFVGRDQVIPTFGDVESDAERETAARKEVTDKLREEEEERRRLQAKGDADYFANQRSFHPMFGGTFDLRGADAPNADMSPDALARYGQRVQDPLTGDWFPDIKSLRQWTEFRDAVGTYWDGSQIPFSHWEGDYPMPPRTYIGSYQGVGYKFATAKERDRFVDDGIFPNGQSVVAKQPDAKDPTKDPTKQPDPNKKPVVVVNDDETTTITTTNTDGSATVVTTDNITGEVLSKEDKPVDVVNQQQVEDIPNIGGISYNEAPMLTEFINSMSFDALQTPPALSLINAFTELDRMKMQGNNEQVQRMTSVAENALDRQATLMRSNADRAFQEGQAIGVVADQMTLAAQAEANRQAWQMAQLTGYAPQMLNGKWVQGQKYEEFTGIGAQASVEREMMGITEESKARDYELALMNMFGMYISPNNPNSLGEIKSLEAQKFGLTKALQMAEVTGKIPDDWSMPVGMTDTNTFSMARFVFEKDMANREADLQDEILTLQQDRMNLDERIEQNKITSSELISQGKLDEAVNARKDASWLANEKIELEKNSLRIETLLSLSKPGTYIFAKHSGLLDDIGGALGINWGDDNVDLPSFAAPGGIPSLTDFQNMSEIEREIVLAEMATTGGFTSDDAIKRILEGAPGGRPDFRRPTGISQGGGIGVIR